MKNINKKKYSMKSTVTENNLLSADTLRYKGVDSERLL